MLCRLRLSPHCYVYANPRRGLEVLLESVKVEYSLPSETGDLSRIHPLVTVKRQAWFKMCTRRARAKIIGGALG